MALTAGAIELWRALRDCGTLLWPLSFTKVLEIGEANWYGDVSASECPELEGCPDDPFMRAKWFYGQIMGTRHTYPSIDMNGPTAQRIDLNCAIDTTKKFDVVINSGTLEHVFNQCQVWKTVHDFTRPGGLMAHSLPIRGWEGHGFYCFQPCLIDDLAFFNGYVEIASVRESLEQGEMLHVAWRRGDGEFRIPQQRKR